MVTNAELAQMFHQIADALEDQDENPYRIRAYRRAAGALKRYPKNIFDMVEQNLDLTEIPHVGTNLSAKIKKLIHEGIANIIPAEKPARDLPANFHNKKISATQLKISVVMPVIERMLHRLQALADISQLACAGSYRRKKELIDEVKIMLVCRHPAKIFEKFCLFPGIRYILVRKKNSIRVQLKIGIFLTLLCTEQKYFGGKLLQATGSIEHYAELKKLAKNQNLALKPNGLYKETIHFGETEELIYQNLGLPFIPAELRENRGEIAAALNGELPELIELKDIKGDLHCHTSETDGSFSLTEMVAAAYEQGYAYVAITDHSQSLKITHGMDEKRLLKQIKQIDKLNEKYSNFRILKSMEVDILADGSLDLANDVLKELDLTVCSVHSKFHLPILQQTERIIRAMDNPYFNILGHATGRILQHRKPYEVDIERIIDSAKARGCFIEVNAQPARLDINDDYCKKAKAAGVKVAISSDAHTMNGFNFMILGVNQARRGWLAASDVINTYELPDLIKLLKRN